jgi:hypothetical protein
MPESRRAWKEDDVAKLKAMAGKVPGERIAAELNRTLGAVAVKACELELSLRTKRRGVRGAADADGAMAGSVSQSPRIGSPSIADRPSIGYRESKRRAVAVPTPRRLFHVQLLHNFRTAGPNRGRHVGPLH